MTKHISIGEWQSAWDALTKKEGEVTYGPPEWNDEYGCFPRPPSDSVTWITPGGPSDSPFNSPDQRLGDLLPPTAYADPIPAATGIKLEWIGIALLVLILVKK